MNTVKKEIKIPTVNLLLKVEGTIDSRIMPIVLRGFDPIFQIRNQSLAQAEEDLSKE